MNSDILEHRRQLEAGFASDNWNQLSFQQRLELCRELENNFAREHGVTPCYVTTMPMDDGTYGYQVNHTIVLNAHILDDGAFHVFLRDEKGQLYFDSNGLPVERIIPVPGVNWSIMETVYHEGTHGIQEVEGRLSPTYIDSNCDYALYRLQSCEKEAFSTGRILTLDAIRTYEEANHIHDPNSERYLNSIEKDTFQYHLNDAIIRYHDPDVEQTLNQFISDRNNGIIPQNPSNSYQAIAQVYDNQEGLGQQGKISLVSINNGYSADSPSAAAKPITVPDNPPKVTNAGFTAEYNIDNSQENDGYGVNAVHLNNSCGIGDDEIDDGYGVVDEADSSIISQVTSGIDDEYGVSSSLADSEFHSEQSPDSSVSDGII